jgi:transcriptional regulator with XRE-family HTH domain
MVEYAKQGTILKEARQAKNLSIEDMALLAGYSTKMWRMIEKGQRKLSTDKIAVVARILEVEDMTLKQFFGKR